MIHERWTDETEARSIMAAYEAQDRNTRRREMRNEWLLMIAGYVAVCALIGLVCVVLR